MGTQLSVLLLSFMELLLTIFALVFFLTVLLPTIIILFVPVYMCRVVLILFTKTWRKEVWKILGGKNPVLAMDDIHGRPLSTIVGMGVFDGEFNLKVARDYVINVVDAKDPRSGLLIHPTLRHYYEEWMGFFWWKAEKEFNMDDHITVWDSQDSSPITEDDFIGIVADLEQRPFSKGKSPWEVVLIPNCSFRSVRDPERLKFVYVFRFHHGLADGVSILQVFMKYVFDSPTAKLVTSTVTQQNKYGKLVHQLAGVLQLPYQFIKQGFTATDVNEWRLPADKLSRRIYKAWSPRINIDLIKEIKQRNRVGFTATLIAAMSGALRNIMIKYDVAVPTKIHAILPLPWPNHPHKFCNHWSYGFIALPVGTAERSERLRKCHKYVENLKKSPSPYVNFAILNFFNLLPTWLMKPFMMTTKFPTMILSNFPGPPVESKGVGGYPLVDAMFTGGPLPGNIGISVTILSYSGALRIVTGVDSSVFPTQHMTDELIQSILQELQQLGAEDIV